MRRCGYCGSNRLKRVHRTFIERFSYLAIYECRECENEEFIPRRYTYHFGAEARCPHCGTLRVTKLRGIDKIDKMVTGPLNRLEKMLGGSLYHCVFCRVQFYDRRRMAPRTVLEPIAPTPEAQAAAPPPIVTPAPEVNATARPALAEGPPPRAASSGA